MFETQHLNLCSSFIRILPIRGGWGAWGTQGSTVGIKRAGEMKEDIYLAEIVSGNKCSISTYG